MHIVDGALATEVVIAGSALAVGGVAVGLRQLDIDEIPVAGVLSACFFVASLIHVPLGPTSVHIMLNGLLGMVLGWAAFPAVLVGLILQAVFFGFGGVTVLGINTFNVALPAVVVYYVCRSGLKEGSSRRAAVWGGVGGALAIALTALMVAVSLALSGEAFIPAAKLVLIGHVPVMLIEGLLSSAAVYFIHRTKPEMFGVLERTYHADVMPR